MQSSAFMRLQMLPFFQGISQDELLRILERAKFDFVSLETGELIAEQGRVASHLVYALNGKFQAQCRFSEVFYVVEELDAPFVFQPESLFGVSPTWRYTLTPLSDAQLLLISKHDFLHHLMDFPTFRLSLLNYLCGLSDKSASRLLLPPSPDLRSSLLRFFEEHVMHKRGKKTFHVGMQHLADSLSVSRLSVSRCLRCLQEEGLIELGRQEITIPDFTLLQNG
ncbi:MAG: helix-turn-helix domain-containing protein [Bacteroidaceae bacterium]|nr:helix-turn-helix domain-containing protein [Bacteroidaceae bacterium]